MMFKQAIVTFFTTLGVLLTLSSTQLLAAEPQPALIDAFYQNLWWRCTSDNFNFTVSSISLEHVKDCKPGYQLDFFENFVRLPQLNNPLSVLTNLGEFGALRYEVNAPSGTGPYTLRLQLVDKTSSALFSGFSVSGNILTVTYPKESYATLSEYLYSVTLNGSPATFSLVGFANDTAATLQLDRVVGPSDAVVFSYEKNGVSQNLAVTTITTGGTVNPVDNTDGNTTTGGNEQTYHTVIMTPQSNTGDTALPGCANKPDVDPNNCRFTGSITNEVYAMGFVFNGTVDHSSLPYNIHFDTRDTMFGADVYDRVFVMSIDEVPGRFTAGNTRCTTDLAGSAVNSIPVLDDQLKPSLSAFNQANTCFLTPGRTYYINIKPKNPGCGLGVITHHEMGCRVFIFNDLPYYSYSNN